MSRCDEMPRSVREMGRRHPLFDPGRNFMDAWFLYGVLAMLGGGIGLPLFIQLLEGVCCH